MSDDVAAFFTGIILSLVFSVPTCYYVIIPRAKETIRQEAKQEGAGRYELDHDDNKVWKWIKPLEEL